MPSIAFLVACTCHAVLATPGVYTFNAWGIPFLNIGASLFSAIALLIALVLGVLSLVRQPSGGAWIKAALVFLVLGPIAFFGLLYPISRELMISSHCYNEIRFTCQALVSDVTQSQFLMAVVAWCAVACAALAASSRTNRTLSPQ